MKYLVKIPMHVTLDVKVDCHDVEEAVRVAMEFKDHPLCPKCAAHFTLHGPITNESLDIEVDEIDEEL